MTSLLAIDFGERRTGVALLETELGLASPLATLERRSDEELVRELDRVARRHDASGFVLGLPTLLDGTEAAAAARVRSFARKLGAATDRQVRLVEETLTSREAADRVREGSADGRHGLDAVAAQLIGEQYLRDELGPTAAPAAGEHRR